MRKFVKGCFCLLLLLAGGCKDVEVDFGLECEYLDNPVGVDIAEGIRLNWTLPDVKGIKDDSLQVFLSENREAVERMDGVCLYKTLPPLSVKMCCDRLDLKPATAYYWKVRAKDGCVSETASFVTAFSLDDALWISDGKDIHEKSSVCYVKRVNVKPSLARAYFVVASAGLHEIKINGDKVGNHCLDPMFTRFDKRVLSVAHDVTSFLREGQNELCVQLGNGWYNHQSVAVWNYDKVSWRGRPCFCGKLVLEYENGNRETVSTDSSWKAKETPIVFNSIYTAEHYDARKEYETFPLVPVAVVPSPTERISPQQVRPVRVVDTLYCQTLNKLNDSLYVYAFPRNIAGIVRLKVKGKKGEVLRLKHGELLNADGTVNTGNIDYHYRPVDDSDPFQVDVVTLSGEEDLFEPKFNYKGFQYVEVAASSPVKMEKESVVALEMHSDVPVKGHWHSSSEILNRLWEATNSSYLANLFGYPTDCPQREKNGWTGDAHLAIEVGLYNFDVITIYEKWMNDFVDEQRADGTLPAIVPTSGWGYDWGNGVDWTSAVEIIPWMIYRYYGDDTLLRRMYQPMKRHLDRVSEAADNYLVDWGLGDWIPVKSKSNVELTVSVYYYVDACILSRTAKLLGKEEDCLYYGKLAGNIRDAINARYLDSSSGLYASGTQTELAMPLYWGVVPDSVRARVADALNRRVIADGYHLDVGVHGCKALLGALSDNGFIDTAYKLATQTDFPSWGYWITQGATTLHENWRTDVIIDNSLNHIMFGEVGAWLYKSLAGIRPDVDVAGFEKTHVCPYFPEDMQHLDVAYKTSYGELRIGWRREEGRIVYRLHVPEAMTVVLHAPGNRTEICSGGDYEFEWNE